MQCNGSALEAAGAIFQLKKKNSLGETRRKINSERKREVILVTRSLLKQGLIHEKKEGKIEG
jgi:hypothetical protein